MPNRFPGFFSCSGAAGLPCKMYFIPEHRVSVKPLITDLFCEFSKAEMPWGIQPCLFRVFPAPGQYCFFCL